MTATPSNRLRVTGGMELMTEEKSAMVGADGEGKAR
jgi:hypothetical protein